MKLFTGFTGKKIPGGAYELEKTQTLFFFSLRNQLVQGIFAQLFYAELRVGNLPPKC